MIDNSKKDQLSFSAQIMYGASLDISEELPDKNDPPFIEKKGIYELKATCIDNGIAPYSVGYLKAAKILSSLITYSNNGSDTLIYPIAFLYRHYIEIMLKDLIRDGLQIIDSEVDNSIEKALGEHKLIVLWDILIPIIRKISIYSGGSEDDFDPTIEGFSKYINQINSVDPSSFTFRYDTDKLGNSLKSNIDKIILTEFLTSMEKVTNLLETLRFQFSVTLEAKGEIIEYSL